MTKYVPSSGLEVSGQGVGLRKWAHFSQVQRSAWPGSRQASKTLDYYSPLARQLSPSARLHYFWLPVLPSSERQRVRAATWSCAERVFSVSVGTSLLELGAGRRCAGQAAGPRWVPEQAGSAPSLWSAGPRQDTECCLFPRPSLGAWSSWMRGAPRTEGS